MKGEIPLPTELQHLRNMIEDAQSDTGIKLLRKLIKSAADKASATDIIKISQAILQCGIDIERGKWARRN